MSLEDSTFKTSRVLDNEIIKASDFEFAFEQLVENVSKATQMLLESNQDFVINGKVLPAGGLNVSVSPIYGVCKTSDGGKPFGRTEETDETIGFEGSESGRVDIIEVQGDWQTYDNQQRAFNDPDTDVQTYQYVDTKRLMKPVYQVKKGVEGSETAPDHDTGWVKLAEVKIRAGVTVIASTDIKNITADVAGMDNDDWTNEKDVTYNIGYISDVNARFRVQHNEDGTHADDSINSDSLDIGTGAKQINGNVLPIGGSVSIPNESIASSDSILSVIVKAAAMITTLYNAYLKYGNYNFKGDLSVSSIADANNVLTKPITIHAEGDGTAVIKVDGNVVFSIDVNGKLSTNGYTASSANHIVTKTVTDGLKSLIDALDLRVTALENTADATVYANGVISSGSTGRFNPDSTSIFAATTTNITLSGSQTIDGTTPTDGVTILVKNQTDATENGFYQYSSNSAWSRTNGFLSPESLKSKLFTVSGGTVNGNKMFYVPRVNFTDPSSFGTDDIEFLEYFGAVKAVANKVIIRDANGRAQVAAPSASYDIAVKKNIDDLYGNVTPSGLGTAAVGTCTTFARSDHVHPVQNFIPYTGAGNGVVTAYQSSAAYCGSAAEWASYLIFNHGDGSSYYNQMIRMPFGGVPQYQRKSAGTNSGWKTFITSENIGSQSVNYATSAGSAGSATNATNACKSYCVMDYCSNTTPLYIAYAKTGLAANQVTHLAAFSTNYETGKTFIKDASIDVIKSWLGLGSAAYTASTAYLAASGCAADSAKLGGKDPSALCVACAGANGSGVAFGTAATCAATAFRASTWTPTCVACANRFGVCYSYSSCCTWLCWCYCCTAGSCKFGRLYIYNCAPNVVETMLPLFCTGCVSDMMLSQYGMRVGIPIQISAQSYHQLKRPDGSVLFSACTFPTSNQKYYMDSRSVLTTN